MKKLAVSEAIAVLIGTIIGAGVFTLPYVAVHSGLVITLIWLIIVSFIIIYLHLAFGEIVLRTKKDFRLPGYIGHYLNSSAKKFVLLITFFTFSFSLLIYLLLGSEFLGVIFNSIWSNFSLPQGFLVIFPWLLLSLVVLSKSRGVSKINFYLSFALLFYFLLLLFLLYLISIQKILIFLILQTTGVGKYLMVFYFLLSMVWWQSLKQQKF